MVTLARASPAPPQPLSHPFLTPTLWGLGMKVEPRDEDTPPPPLPLWPCSAILELCGCLWGSPSDLPRYSLGWS